MKNVNILITGAGGPAAICAYKSLSKEYYTMHMADMDPLSAGLYMVEDFNRHIIPAAAEENFVEELIITCLDNQIDVLIPTVDMELIKIANRKEDFEAIGTKVLVADEAVLRNIMNKHTLLSKLEDSLDVGQFEMLSSSSSKDWANKRIVIKPVSGSGSRGVEILDSYFDIDERHFDDKSMMIQEFIEGPEYSVDVMVDQKGEVKATAPRLRMKTDSGVSVTGKIDNNKDVIEYAKKVAETIGLTFAGNIQIILHPEHGPRLVEINPRFSGGLSLVIEAGANTPLMCVKEIMGETVEPVEHVKELAMVRSFNERYMLANQLMNI